MVYKTNHKYSKKKAPRNWGLLWYMKNAEDEEVQNIEDQIGNYLLETAKPPKKSNTAVLFCVQQESQG